MTSKSVYTFRNLDPDYFGWFVGGVFQGRDKLHKGILEHCVSQEDAIDRANRLLASRGARDIKIGRF